MHQVSENSWIRVGMRLMLVLFLSATLFAWFQQEAHSPSYSSHPVKSYARNPAQFELEFTAAEKSLLLQRLQQEAQRQLDLIKNEELKPARGPFAVIAREVSRKLVEVKEVAQLAKIVGKSAGRAVLVTFLVTNFVIPPTMMSMGAAGLMPLWFTGAVSLWSGFAPNELFVAIGVMIKKSRRLENQLRKEIGEEAYQQAKELKARLSTPMGRKRVLSLVYPHIEGNEDLRMRLEVHHNAWYRNWFVRSDDFGEAMSVKELEAIILTHDEGGRAYLDSVYPLISKKKQYALLLLNYIFAHEETLESLRERMRPSRSFATGSDDWLRHHLDLFEDYKDELKYSQAQILNASKDIKTQLKQNADEYETKPLSAFADDVVNRRTQEFGMLIEGMRRKELLMLDAAIEGKEFPMEDFISGLKAEMENRRKILSALEDMAQDPLGNFETVKQMEEEMWGEFPARKSIKEKCSLALKNLVGAWPNFMK